MLGRKRLGHPEATAADLEAMTEPRSEMELQAEIDALPLKQRSDLIEAVHGGRAVNDGDLAALAAEWASASRRGLLRAFVLLSPFLVVTVLAMVWFMSRHDSPLSFVGMDVIAGSALTITALLGWAIAWRPLVRAEQANRAKLGLGPPPRRREPSHWVIAWMAAWWIGVVVGALLHAAGISAFSGPVGVIVWIISIWLIKRLLDSRG